MSDEKEEKKVQLNTEILTEQEFQEKKKILEEKKVKIVKIKENVYKTKLYD